MVKKGVYSLPMVRRMFTSIVLGILFGLLCAYLVSRGSTDSNYWGSVLMWNIVFNRILIGLVISFAGFIVVHPVFKVRMYPALRGALLGAIVSLDVAIGTLMSGKDNVWSLFWAYIIAGAFYGLIIDVIATKVGGEGEMLLEGTKN